MKVLLIQAPLGRKGGVLSTFPLGLAYLSGALKDHELTVLDPNIGEKINNLSKNDSFLRMLGFLGEKAI